MTTYDEKNEPAGKELQETPQEELQETEEAGGLEEEELADSEEETGETDEEETDEESGDEEEPEEEAGGSEDDAGEEDIAEDSDAEAEEEETPASEEEGKVQEKGNRKRRLLRRLLRENDSDDESLKDMFNDIQISGEWVKQHWSFLLLLFFCMLLFVTNRYQAQQEIIEEAQLKEELQDWKYVWLTQFSELTRSTRQSYIEESLRQRGDSTLKISKEAPFIIKAE